jgi:peptidoglycan/LPS O-acetylase OafA/YrhL
MSLNKTKEENTIPNSGNIGHQKYRTDIDGLRAVAILSVVVYHAFPILLKGGFIGVDIFFVISGYLISTIIFNSLERGSFSFYDFYSRRIRRIFPALLFVLIFCYTFGWFFLLADEYKQLGKHIAAGAGFLSNLVLWKESGYFEVAAETKPLLHLWSLALEEQFYIVWPVILWAAWGKKINLFTISMVLFFVSFGLNLIKYRVDGVADFYSPQTRFWELLVGSLLAYIKHHDYQVIFLTKERLDTWLGKFFYGHPFEVKGQTIRDAQSLFGALLIVLGLALIDKEKHFPGTWATLPVLGAVCIIAAGSNSWFNRIFLSNRIMVWFGIISFPLYLWHWPLLSFARIIEGEVPAQSTRIAAVFLSIALAWLTNKLVEHPLRFGGREKIKVSFLIIMMTLIGYIGYNTYRRDGLAFRDEQFNKILIAAGEWDYPGALSRGKLNGINYLIQNSNGKKSTLFIGDSNIEQFYPRVEELIKNSPEITNNALFKTGGGCFPVPGIKYAQTHAHCENIMRDALYLAINMEDIENVVIGAHWNQYLLNGKNLYKKIEHGNDSYYAALSNLSSFIIELINQKKKVFLVLNIPTGKELDPKYIVYRQIEHFPNIFKIRDGGIDRESFANRYGMIQLDLIRLADQAGAVLINPIDYLCNERCDSLDKSGAPIYKDSTHLRPTFVRKHANFIDQTVRN